MFVGCPHNKFRAYVIHVHPAFGIGGLFLGVIGIAYEVGMICPGTEKNGIEYYFITPDEFRERIANDEFLEYEEVYAGKFYGTLKSEVERILDSGKNVIFDVDVVGGLNIKKYYGNQALALFIQPPSIQALEQRLKNRATDTPEVIAHRIAKAEYELSFAPKFDKIIVNDILEKAQEEAYRSIRQFLDK